tara:strand:+ start:66 stop:1040 length:975 start_codon:yes stop_codon:yes gene_type:complete
MKIKEAITSLKKDMIYPIYSLKGGDHFLQNFFIERLSEEYFGSSKIEKILMLPDDMSGNEIVDRITTIDLFSTKKIFIIRDPQKIKGKASIDLINFCKNPVADCVTVFLNDDWTIKSSFLSKIEANAMQVDVQTPFANDLKKWTKFLIKKRGKTTNSFVENTLIEMAGDSLVHLDNEIEKICLIINDRNVIKIEDVERFSGWERDRQRWEFLLALGGKKYSKAIFLGRNLITKSESMLSLIIPLTALFQEMLFHKLENGTFNGHKGYIPLPPSVKKRVANFSRLFEIVEIANALKKLSEIDKRQKSTYSKDETELIQFIGNVIG